MGKTTGRNTKKFYRVEKHYNGIINYVPTIVVLSYYVSFHFNSAFIAPPHLSSVLRAPKKTLCLKNRFFTTLKT